MPIYEYRCKKCNKEFEFLVLGNNDAVTCPECDTKRVERLMSSCSFKSGGDFSPAGGASGCSTCSSGNCSSCH
ncbi:MAG: zinc ribbon domain-containing protein [Deltaproteobacteria bacterium]|nr:zinc ribbon domain-containing protein [Deltaproteobacteria bacterium]